MSKKNFSDTIGNQTHNLPVCSTVKGTISTIKIMSITLGLKHPGKQLLGLKEEVNRWENCEAVTWIVLVMTE